MGSTPIGAAVFVFVMFKLLVCFIILLSACIAPSTVFGSSHFGEVSPAQVNEALANTVQVRFLPPNPLYYLSRIKENFSRFFMASSVERAQFDFIISSKRLREAYELGEKGKSDFANDSLSAYSSALDRSIGRLKKARSQNQEVLPAVDEMVNDLNYQEILLIYLVTRGYNNLNTQNAIDSFKSYAGELNGLKPGILARFKILKKESSGESSPSANIGRVDNVVIEPTASATPKRFIY